MLEMPLAVIGQSETATSNTVLTYLSNGQAKTVYYLLQFVTVYREYSNQIETLV